MISAGPLRHKIAIQSPPTAKGSRGELTGPWVNEGTAWCSIRTLSGREAEQARKVYAEAEFEVVLRNNKNKPLRTEQRFIFGQRILNIGHIANMQQLDQVLRVLCKSDEGLISPIIGSTFAPEWDIRETIQGTYSPEWDILNAISDAFGPSWDVLAGEVATFAPEWDIEGLQPVGNTFEPEWDIEATTSATFEPEWDIEGDAPVIPPTAIQALWWTE